MLSRIRAAAAAARDSGALKTIETEQAITHGEVPFLVRRVSSLKRKDAAAAARAAAATKPAARAPDFNPFLPYDPAMHVADLAPAHVLLLNKFNVVADHVLIVTAAFAPQSDLLSAADFAATWAVLRDVDGLAFYNAGKTAGASQPHKHLQLVPTPLTDALDSPTPIEAALDLSSPAAAAGGAYTSTRLPFLHRLSLLDASCASLPPRAAAAATMERYTALLSALAADLAHAPAADAAPAQQPFAYNLLLTRRWLLVVPRAREWADVAGGRVSVNALGFAGSLFVRDPEQMAAVRADPMGVLSAVTFPPAAHA